MLLIIIKFVPFSVNFWFAGWQAVRCSLYGRPGPSYIEIPGNMINKSIASKRVRYSLCVCYKNKNKIVQEIDDCIKHTNNGGMGYSYYREYHCVN